MNRSEALQRWARAEAGDLEHGQACPVDLHAWIRQVAKDILKADAEPAGARPGAVLAAVGLAGKVDGYAELRAFVHGVQWDFRTIGKDGLDVEEARGDLVRQMAAQARRLGLLKGDDEEKSLQLIRDLKAGRK